GSACVLEGILATPPLYPVQLYVMGGGHLSLGALRTLPEAAERLWFALHLPDAITIHGTSVSAALFSSLAVFVAWALFSIWVLARFLRTDLGLALRAAGGNAQ